MSFPIPPASNVALNIWCNAEFPYAAMSELRSGLGELNPEHRLILPATRQASNLVAGGPDPTLEQADVALGQPDPEQAMRLPRLRWVHLTSAGYTRYDRDDLKAAFRARRAALTNSSAVYAEPCAQHVLAMMLGFARRLPQCLEDQRAASPPWRATEHRIRSHLLTGQSAVLLGYGAIGRRLVELLTPLRMRLIAVRRRVQGDEPVEAVTEGEVNRVLPDADHVVNILPANESTERFLTGERLAKLKPGAIVYNIGRGTTVDQAALVESLVAGRIAGAYLDVTDPEPLPPDHPLWTAPNCYVTPHTAGGHADEFHRLVRHFLENAGRFSRGEDLRDRVI